MPINSDGSRICDSNRVALKAIDTSHTLTNKTDRIIYAAGCFADAVRIDDPGGQVEWAFRTPPGAGGWTKIGAATAISTVDVVSETVLADGTLVTAASGRTTQTDHVEAGAECENDTAQDHNSAARVEDQSTEAQFAMRFDNAADDTTYEISVVWDDDGQAQTRIVYAAQITTPAAVGGLDFPPLFSRENKQHTYLRM